MSEVAAAAPAASAPTPPPAEVTDADLDRIAGEAFDRIMSGDKDKPADAAPAQAAPKTDEQKADAKASGERNEKGQFVSQKKDETAAPAADAKKTDEKAVAAALPKEGEKAEGEDAEKAEAEPAKPKHAPPTSWAALRDEWDTLSESAQQKIIAREREINDGFSKQGRVLKALEPVRETLEKHGDVFDRLGAPPAAVVDSLIKQYRALNQEPERIIPMLAKEYGQDLLKLAVGKDPAAAIQTIAKQSGIDLLDLIANGDTTSARAAVDPRIDQLEAELRATREENRRVQAYLAQQEQNARAMDEAARQQRESGVLSTIEPIIASTPDWNELAPRVEALLPLVQKENPTLPPDEVLKIAIDDARRADRKAYEKFVAAEAAKKTKATVSQLTQHADKASNAARANIKGAASGGPAPLSEQAEIDAIWSKMRA